MGQTLYFTSPGWHVEATRLGVSPQCIALGGAELGSRSDVHQRYELRPLGFVERALIEAGTREQSLAGEIVSPDGRVVGTHRGVHRYTIGQRRGLGVSHASPLYVIDLDPRKKLVVVGDRSRLARQSFRAERANWIAIPEPEEALRAAIKIRSRHAEAPATITPLGGSAVRVDFDTPQFAVTPGQAAVFYRGEMVIGGAWIMRES